MRGLVGFLIGVALVAIPVFAVALGVPVARWAFRAVARLSRRVDRALNDPRQ